MLNITLTRWVLTVLLCGVAADRGFAAVEAGEERSKKAKRSFEEVIFDKADFLSRLPKKTLVSPFGGRPHRAEMVETAKKNLAKALAEFGDPGDRELVLLPQTATHPKVARHVAPTYPRDLREQGVTGEALFLVLVNAEGKVGALHCPFYTDRRFAIHGAAAIARWTYNSGELGETAVPVLIAQPISFSLN